MSNIKIFRANRGEGKTKWLAERIKECAEAGECLLYVGQEWTFSNVKRVYEATYKEVCPVEMADAFRCFTPYDTFFTDELIDNVTSVAKYKSYIIDNGCDWYITMSQEDFVD